MIGLRRAQPRWAPTESGMDWKDATLGEMGGKKSSSAGRRWAIAGALTGVLVGLVAFAPASWLAGMVGSLSNNHVILSDARGTIWNGSAMVVLTGGAGSKDASALPGRAQWTLGFHKAGLEVQASHACCLNGRVVMQITPGWGRMRLNLVPSASGWIGQWPSSWLAGLGTPWNTMQLQGAMRLTSSGLTVESVQGRWLVTGKAQLDLANVSSKLLPGQPLGSYQLSLQGDGGASGGSALTLTTQSGALQLSGSGTWGASGVRFSGEARSSEDQSTALDNLLNIIGRRDGARSVISIG
jgi:general secretion pathway protein N